MACRHVQGSETTCNVVDYDKNGVVTGFSTQCVKEGTSCPCGKNTISCPDPNDVPWPVLGITWACLGMLFFALQPWPLNQREND